MFKCLRSWRILSQWLLHSGFPFWACAGEDGTSGACHRHVFDVPVHTGPLFCHLFKYSMKCRLIAYVEWIHCGYFCTGFIVLLSIHFYLYLASSERINTAVSTNLRPRCYITNQGKDIACHHFKPPSHKCQNNILSGNHLSIFQEHDCNNQNLLSYRQKSGRIICQRIKTTYTTSHTTNRMYWFLHTSTWTNSSLKSDCTLLWIRADLLTTDPAIDDSITDIRELQKYCTNIDEQEITPNPILRHNWLWILSLWIHLHDSY